MSRPPEPIVHAFPQNEPNDAVYIVGTVTGLLLLREVLDAAIACQSVASGAFRSSDGNGFTCVVTCASPTQMQEVPLAYMDLPDDRTLPEWVRVAGQEENPPPGLSRKKPAEPYVPPPPLTLSKV